MHPVLNDIALTQKQIPDLCAGKIGTYLTSAAELFAMTRIFIVDLFQTRDVSERAGKHLKRRAREGREPRKP